MRAVLTALLSALLLVRAIPASAQDTGLGGSFINPFPENDTYQVQVVGDWLADGLMGGLGEAFATGPGVVVSKKRYDLPALMLNRTDGDLAALEQAFANDPSHIAIVMLGAQDRYNVGPRLASGQQGNWRNDYAARVDRVMKTLRKGGRAVYWVGLPNMRRWQDNERAQLMNDVFRERAYLNGVRYIDAYASFIDEGGGYSDYGPDVTGKVARLRDTDGVHFTDIGYRKLAHFVERELRRDIAQAKDERAVPLAGDASEQARVNPDRARLKADAAPGTPGAPAPGQKAKPKEARRAAARRGRQGAEGGHGQGRYQGGRSRRHRADRLRRHRAPGDPRLRRRARHPQAERRQAGADGRHPRRPDSGRVDRHELDRAAARRRRAPPPVADADALFPRVRARRPAAVQARPRRRFHLAAPAGDRRGGHARSPARRTGHDWRHPEAPLAARRGADSPGIASPVQVVSADRD